MAALLVPGESGAEEPGQDDLKTFEIIMRDALKFDREFASR